LQAIDGPCYDGTERVEAHGEINQVSEHTGVGEAKVEEQECHLDHPVHPYVIDFFDEESLRTLEKKMKGLVVLDSGHSRMLS
jgi:hypothetical protein